MHYMDNLILFLKCENLLESETNLIKLKMHKENQNYNHTVNIIDIQKS